MYISYILYCILDVTYDTSCVQEGGTSEVTTTRYPEKSASRVGHDAGHQWRNLIESKSSRGWPRARHAMKCRHPNAEHVKQESVQKCI